MNETLDTLQQLSRLEAEIEKLKQKSFRWIPVGEGLPDEGHLDFDRDVLCWFPKHNQYNLTKGKYIYTYGGGITHWTHIPPLPEKSQGEKDLEACEKALEEADPGDNMQRTYFQSGYFAGLKAAREQKAP